MMQLGELRRAAWREPCRSLEGLQTLWHCNKNSPVIWAYFEETAFNPYARAPRGQKVYANKVGNRKKKRTHLIMAQR